MINYTKRVARGSGLIFVFSILASVFSYLLRLFLAKNLSIEDFGLFYAVFTFVTFFALFQDLGLGSALIKFITDFKIKNEFDKIKTVVYYVFGIQLVFTILAAVLIIILSDFLSLNYFKLPESRTIIIFFALWFVLNSIIVTISQIFYGLQNIFAYSSRVFVVNLSILLATVVLYQFGFGIMSAVYSFIFSTIIAIIIYTPMLFREFNIFKYKFIKSRHLLKKIIIFGLPIMSILISSKMISYVDILMMTYYRPIWEVGVYNAVLPTTLLLLLFGKPLRSILFPLASEMNMKDEKKKLADGLNSLQKYIFIFTLPVAMMLFSFSDTFLELFFGSSFLSGATAMKILVVGMVFFAIAQINVGVLIGLGKPHKYALVIGFAAILNTLLNFILIPSFGMNGAAISTALSYIIVFVILLVYLAKEIRLKIPLIEWIKTFMIVIILTSITAILKNFVEINSLLKIFVVFLITSLLYVTLLFLFGVVSLKELTLLIRRTFGS